MPASWKVLLIVTFVFVVASIVVGAYQLAHTPTEILGANFEGLPESEFPR
jgi:hypothetical protein